MILLEVRDYIKEKKWVNLRDLSHHFKRDPGMMRDLLEHWIRKGVIRRAPQPEGCGVSCGQCQPSIAEVYCYCDVILEPIQSCH